jgi:hypothetical protein
LLIVGFEIGMDESQLRVGFLELARFEEMETQDYVEEEVEFGAVVRFLSEYLEHVKLNIFILFQFYISVMKYSLYSFIIVEVTICVSLIRPP